MNWKLKTALRHTILALPGGARLYRLLTARVLGTQHGMAAKWFRVLPNHLAVVRNHFGDDARNVPWWCYDSGFTPAAGFAIAVVSDVPGLLTDRLDRLTDRYLPTSRRILAEKGPELARLSDATADRFAEVTRAANRSGRATDAFGMLGIHYSGSHASALDEPWRGKVGVIFSAGTLEHYRPEEVEAELARMHAALRPGGLLSHVIDHRDHRWHADKSLSPFKHLTLGTEEYTRRFDNPLDYHNRWLQSDWVCALERHGFEVKPRTKEPYGPEHVPLDATRLDAAFRDRPAGDLDALVSHIVAIKR